MGKDSSGVQNEASKILLPLKSTMTNSERFEDAMICKQIQEYVLPLAKHKPSHDFREEKY